MHDSLKKVGMLLPIYKEHNLSSIHNWNLPTLSTNKVVTNIQRTQFKFNSQQFY